MKKMHEITIWINEIDRHILSFFLKKILLSIKFKIIKEISWRHDSQDWSKIFILDKGCLSVYTFYSGKKTYVHLVTHDENRYKGFESKILERSDVLNSYSYNTAPKNKKKIKNCAHENMVTIMNTGKENQYWMIDIEEKICPDCGEDCSNMFLIKK